MNDVLVALAASPPLSHPPLPCRFNWCRSRRSWTLGLHCSGSGTRLSFFKGGMGMDEEEENIPKGDDVVVELHATLDLYMGGSLKVWKEKVVIKPAPGKWPL